MLLYYHPLVIYRHQVIKQADTVLAMFLLSNEFPWYIRKRNFDYYKPLTTGDSSLSACVEGIVAFDCGYIEMGYDYLRQTILLDFLDSHGNTKDGLHTASMGGSWMAIVYGIAGFRFLDGIPRFRPTLPKSITHIKFSLIFNANRLDISLTRESTTYSCDREIELYHRSTPIHLKNNSITISTAPQIKAVIFDLDGVITSTDEYHFKAWKALCDEHGWKFSKELNQHLRGISREASLQVILDHNNIHYNRKIIESLTNKKNSMYVQSLEALSSANILPGIRELLTDLREHHIYTAIASASKNASFILEKLEIVHLFDYIVDAGDVIKGKPDPEVFVRAASALHLFPEECAAIEDSRAGISAITSGRMKSIGVGDAVDPALCNIYVKSTSMLKMGDIIG
jgi:alpha,alpha-trehalose phosphorylase